MSSKKKVRHTLLELLKWTPEGKEILKDVSKIVNGKGAYQKGDEDCPFVSEAYLYNLLGKEDARTFLALLNNIIREMGLDMDELEEEVSKDILKN